MKNIFVLFILFFLNNGYTLGDFKITNTLKYCLTINSVSILNKDKLIKFQLNTIKSVGHCGCKSSIGSYTIINNDLSDIDTNFKIEDDKEVLLSLSTKNFSNLSAKEIIIGCSH